MGNISVTIKRKGLEDSIRKAVLFTKSRPHKVKRDTLPRKAKHKKSLIPS
jgi:hypothetical protein